MTKLILIVSIFASSFSFAQRHVGQGQAGTRGGGSGGGGQARPSTSNTAPSGPSQTQGPQQQNHAHQD